MQYQHENDDMGEEEEEQAYEPDMNEVDWKFNNLNIKFWIVLLDQLNN